MTKQDPSLILRLYRDQGKTLNEVSRELGISISTARKHLTRQIQLRPSSEPLYRRVPFSGSEAEKAYLMGYRAGDVNAFQDSALTVTARVSTTHQSMIDMFRATFAHHGHCTMIPRRVFLTGYDWQVKVYLDNSFRFLIPKTTALPTNPALLYVFMAGFNDSDGCWSASDKHGKTTFSFDLTSRSHELLDILAAVLRKENYHPYVYLSRAKGTVKLVKGIRGTRAITLAADAWTLVVKR